MLLVYRLQVRLLIVRSRVRRYMLQNYQHIGVCNTVMEYIDKKPETWSQKYVNPRQNPTRQFEFCYQGP